MVLVNSANVRYREVELDGHIHFIGTQGTGKSTLLRALLFFYNADSRRLGISKEKKAFADYYFPFADSYIFYEVQAGERRYCVWLYKRQNRLCFRFMDGGYQPDLALDGNSARGEAEVLARAAELNIKVERAIHGFSDYRDILYGENRSMRRYALMTHVPNYSTVPRTISNIFLNANLDGGYIKKTIIDSLSEDAVEINLETNRHHLDTARAHYADVMQYRRNEPKAEQIVAAYETVLDLEQRQREAAWKIGAAFNQAREQVRGLESEMAAKAEEEREQAAKLVNVQQQAETEKRRLGDRLAVVKKNISTANEKKRHYDTLGITELIRQAEERPRLEQEHNHCSEQLRVLTSKAEQQEQRFANALQRLENESEGRVHQLRAALGEVKDRLRNEQDVARKRFDEQSGRLVSEFEESVGGYRESRVEAAKEFQGLESELFRLDHIPLFAEDTARLDTHGRELEHQRIRTDEARKQLVESIEALRNEARMQQALAESEGENQVRPLTDERAVQTALLEERRQELKALDGSLLEFLDDKVGGWQETIGKVVRRDVLLKSGLNPRKQDGRTLYGIDIQLEHLETEPLSKKALLEEVAEIESGLTELAKGIEKQLAENRDGLARLEQKYNRKIRGLQDRAKQVAEELFKLERDLERNVLEREQLAEKVTTERSARQATVEEKMHKARQQMQELDALIADLSEKNAADQKRLAADLNKRIKQLGNELRQHESETAQKIEEQKLWLTERRGELEKQRKAALEKAGVDARQVAELETRAEAIQKQLNEIRATERSRIEYEKDRAEWIDRLAEFQNDRAQLENKLEHQTVLFDRRIRQEKELRAELILALEKLRETNRRLKDEISAFEAFEREELFADFEASIRHHDASEATHCIEQINLLKNLALEYQGKYTKLTERVTAFSGLFSEGNCLGFETHLSGKASFRAFADGLSSFIREQKLTTLQTEVTRKYSMVLETIVTETHRLLKREDEVHRVIQKINGDFRASNFVGVVRSIEMRLLDSSNRIFQALREICAFQAEHHMGFGEIDLFNLGNSGNDEKAVELLDELRIQMGQAKSTVLRLEDALDLEFRVCENENDTGWVSRLANVGSNGTDVLVKSMIYINLLNIFKSASRKGAEVAQLHCLVDEVGILHDSNVTSLIRFAAERGICMINGSPNSHNEQDYKHIYIFRKEGNETAITKLLSHAS
jgi:hypothetical protein